MRERNDKAKKIYEIKRREGDEAYKSQSNFSNYCKLHELKYLKFYPHLSPIERNAKLWEDYCAQEEKESQII